MSLQRGIFIFLIISSLIGLSMIFIRRYSQTTCPSGDSRVCAFVNKNRLISGEAMKGTYQQVGDDEENNLTIKWEKNKDISRTVISKQENEILDIISTTKYLFLKDYSDNLWWRQDKEIVMNSLSQLPFNSELYFKELQNIITGEHTTFTFIQEATCGKATCYRYQVLFPKQKDDDQLFVFFKKDTFELQSLFFAHGKGTGELEIEYADVAITEPEKIKIAPSGKNLFVEYMDRKEQKVEKNYEYVKQFEQERKEAEQNGSSSALLYKEETPTPTSTL